jgi:hypothetical protein
MSDGIDGFHMLLNARSLIACLALAAAAAPPLAEAETFVVSIDAKIFDGLGVCYDSVSTPWGVGPCDGAPPIGVPDSINAPSWAQNLPPRAQPYYFDLLRMQALYKTVDTTTLQSFTDTVDFAIGDTGGGSAGTTVGGSLLHPVTLERTVSIIGAVTTQNYTLIQTGVLAVGWTESLESFVLNPADLLVTLDSGQQLNLHFDGINSWAIHTDPTQAMAISVSAVPEPPAATMYCVGLAGMLAWGRWRKRRAV